MEEWNGRIASEDHLMAVLLPATKSRSLPGVTDSRRKYEDEWGMVEILPSLWLGDIADARDHPALRRNGISVVLSVERDLSLIGEDGLIRVGTALSENDPDTLERCRRILMTLHGLIQEGHRVLVHCTAGLSRSPAIIAGYLMLTRRLNPDQALEVIRVRKPAILPSWDHVEAIRGILTALRVDLGLDS